MEVEFLTEEMMETDTHVISEYEQTVIQRLDELTSLQAHQYTLGLFWTGCICALFVCILLYKFLLRAFY